MSHFYSFRSWLTTCWVVLLSALGSQVFGYDLVVAKDGTGNYTTVQAAINAAPTTATVPYTIFIRNGKYREKITVPSNKPFLQLVGESVANTILTYNDGASTPLPGGGTIGTQNSASFTVNATDFSALNITFENSYGDGTQAVAVLVNADRAAFKNCRFLGNQDTLYAKGSGTPRHYFKDCYIDGNIDFIFGSSIGVFENCVVYAKSRTTAGTSFITAANTPAGQAAGYVFRKCRFPANTGATQYYLGRPWQNSTGNTPLANNKTVLLSATLSASIRPEGWVTWDAGTNTSLITYAEFQSRFFNGRPVSTSQRVAWSQQLAPADTAAYQTAALFGTWNPCAVAAGFCNTTTPEVAVANLRASKGASTATLDWNISWPIAQLKYELYRSVNNAAYAKINELTALTDTTVNFQLTDAIPPAGSIYKYYLRTSKTGLATHLSDTVQVSSLPTITAVGTLSPFTQYAGGPSAVQAYSLSAVNLTGPVTVTPPAGYEISATGGAPWSTAAAPLVLTGTAGTLAGTTISVRLNAASVGSYAGNITHGGAGASAVTVAVAGTSTTATAPVSLTLQRWPLTASAADDATVRNAGVAASTPTLRRLFVSNGTTVAAIPAYSTAFGQAFGATANGDGSWGTASGGPGGNLSRGFYEQFTVTATTGSSVRVDSLLLTSAFYNTSSNTKLAVVYSRSNFVADSADVTGGAGPTGALAATANGAFNTPVLLANQTGGPTSSYHLALAGAGGLPVVAGQTLTIRVYFSCGSTSNGRYAMLKDVAVKGNRLTPQATALARPSLLHAYPNPLAAGQVLTVEHPATTRAVPISVFGFDGRRVLATASKAGTQATQLDLSGLAAGNYLVLYANETQRLTAKIVRP